MQKWLIIFSWFTWIYRLILFTTIALVVYHFAFKLLGILLLILELWLLVAKPIIAEIRQWPEIGLSRNSRNRILVSAGILGVLGLAFFVPWSTRISVPAILQASNFTVIYPGSSALVKDLDVKRGQSVEKGAILAVLEDRQLLDEIKATHINIASLDRRFSNSIIEQIDAEQMLVLRQSMQLERSKLKGLLQRKEEMVIRAPSDGVIQELNPTLHKGRWLKKTDYIATLIAGTSLKLQGYVAQADISRLAKHAVGRFIPDDLTRPSLAVKLDNIARAGSSELEIAALSTVNGGPIDVNRETDRRLVPVAAQYLVELKPIEATPLPSQLIRGVVDLKGTPKSAFISTWNQISKVIIRESGF